MDWQNLLHKVEAVETPWVPNGGLPVHVLYTILEIEGQEKFRTGSVSFALGPAYRPCV